MTYFAYCITHFPGWVGQILWSNVLVCTAVAETRSKYLRITSTALCQPSYQKPTKMELPWSNVRKKGYLINGCTIASFPIKEQSCWHTTTGIRPQRPVFCHRQRLEIQQILFASQMELSQLGQGDCIPVWRIQEWHTNLCTVSALIDDSWLAFIQPHCGKQDLILNQYKIHRICKICKICRIYTICIISAVLPVPGWLLLLYSSITDTKAQTRSTVELFHPSISLVVDLEQETKFAEPDIINSELKHAVGDTWRVDEHHVLATGLLQFIGCKRPWRNSQTCVKTNVCKDTRYA